MTNSATHSSNVIAPAKLTVTLRVTGVREDGYHLLDAEMVTLDLHDLVTITPTGQGLSASGPFAPGMPLDHRNLVHRALELSQRTAAVHIDKQIPHGGGLGGGSADAAAVLRWAGFTDLERAARIGADVPFCMIGGRARVRGIGEVVDPLEDQPRQFTLVIPPFGVSTPEVYRAWDRLGGPHAEGLNDLEPAALAHEPRLVAWRDRIGELSGLTPTLAGSGSTWFVEGQRVDALAALSNEGARILAATTAPPSR
jgi:4-diphosphocytidyl-2-C-methyl-D-erythritol kinase